jgi:hypothetical protein
MEIRSRASILGRRHIFYCSPPPGSRQPDSRHRIFFTAEGVADLFGYLQARKSVGSGWILFDGIGTLILGLLIWRQWPLSSSWAIGTLVGISMLLTGITRLMITLAARKHGDAYVP